MSEEKTVDPQNPGGSGPECGEERETVSDTEACKTEEACVGATEDLSAKERTSQPAGDSEDVDGEECSEVEAGKLTPEQMQQCLQQQAEQISKLGAEKEELENRLLRLRADFDNFRRRTRLESASLADSAAAKVFLELLPIVDNLERAVAASEGVDQSLQEGVELVLRQFLTTLEKLEVVPIAAVGEEFDPTKHEAVMRVEATDSFPSGTIVEELQKGYMFKDKVLRPSLVKVAG